MNLVVVVGSIVLTLGILVWLFGFWKVLGVMGLGLLALAIVGIALSKTQEH